MRSFDPDVVTRLLDLVSSHFDYVVIDMPRTWFSWTDSVLLGSNQLFIVSEMTVPSLRHAKELVAAIRERLGDGPQPQVIVNRFEQRMFAPGLKKSDIEQALGDDFAGAIPNNYRLVREAIDRGVPLDEVKPGNKITAQLQEADRCRKRAPRLRPAPRRAQKLSLSLSALISWRGSELERDGRPLHRTPRCRRRTGAGRGAESPPTLDGDVVDRRSRSLSRSRDAGAGGAGQPAAQRQVARRQGAPAPPADRGDQSLGAGEAARRRDARAHPAARHAIHRGRAAGAQHAGARTTSSPKSSTR